MILRLFSLAAMAAAIAASAFSEPRIALVIGNSDYTVERWKLDNPVRDARLMRAALKDLGFEVEVVLDADEDAMEDAFARFGSRLKEAGREATGFFFFAGHGVQSEGLNYLIPVDTVAYTEADIWANAPRLELLFRYLENAGNGANFIVLDACRDNPLPSAVRNTAGGLAPAARVRGTLIAYSTAPGAVAEDGNGKYSEFTLALSEMIGQPGMPAETLFRRVATRVEQRTGYRQQPWIESGLRGTEDFCFAGCETDEAARDEAAALAASLGSNDANVLKTFLAAFPKARGRSLVEARIDQLEGKGGAVPASAGRQLSGAQAEEDDPVESEQAEAPRLRTEGEVRAILGVDILISDMVKPWRKDVMQTVARAAVLARTDPDAETTRLMDDALFVFFDEGEDDLTEESRSNLSLFARYTAIPHTDGEEAGRLRVIAGCSKGERDGALCRQRAYVVERFLIAQGVPQAAFEASQSYGRYRPLEDTGFGVDEAMLNQYAMVEILD